MSLKSYVKSKAEALLALATPPPPRPAGPTIVLEYPLRSAPRYGHGKPPHAGLHRLLDRDRARYRDVLESFLPFGDDLARIPVRRGAGGAGPAWINGFLPGLDSAAIYAFLCQRRPRRFLEIGSGNSTLFAHRAIADHALPTRITSIDPHPRADIDAIADVVVRQPLEDTDLAVFDELEGGDVLFLDGSHRCFMNSDVSVFFLDVLPRLPPGVLVQIHDILLPYDYPVEWIERYYSEQYLLAAHLLAGGASTRVVLPGAFVSGDPELKRLLDPIWDRPGLHEVERHGASFWLETVAPA